MILIIPAIDLEHGHCQRCIKGAPGTESLYSTISSHPFELAKLWRRENAKTLHITDHDALDEHNPHSNTETVLSIVRSVDIPVQLLSSFPTAEECAFWLDNGVYRVIINEVLHTDFDGVARLVEKYTPSRIVTGIRAKAGKVVFPDIDLDITDTEVARITKEAGMKRLVYTDISWEGTLCGPDFGMLRDIAAVSGLRVTAAGGVGGPEQLWELQKLQPHGIDSVIVGRALYENRFPCQKMWRRIEAELEPTIIEREL
jgi:phosphoribosylformimino-5-aminoimidazole carboxamide ribotide isomerase